MRFVFAIIVLTAVADSIPVLADSGPTELELKKATDIYVAAIDKAKQELLSKFDKVIDDVNKTKSIAAEDKPAAVSDLKREQQELADKGILPEAPALKPAVAQYQKSADAAVAKLDAAYNKVTRAYAKQGKNAQVAELLRYRNDLVIGEGYELLGEWALADGKDGGGFTERWVIRKTGGHWSVERSFYDEAGGNVGLARSKLAAFSSTELRYTEYYVKKPVGSWLDSVSVTIGKPTADGGRMNAVWRDENSGLNGSHALVRLK